MIPCALQHVNSSNCKVSWETFHGTKSTDVEDDLPKMSISCMKFIEIPWLVGYCRHWATFMVISLWAIQPWRQKPPVFGMPGDHEQYIQNLFITADVLLMHLQSQPHPNSYSSPEPKVGTPVTMFASICVHTYIIYQSNAARFQCLSTKRSRNHVFSAVFFSFGMLQEAMRDSTGEWSDFQEGAALVAGNLG